MREVHFCHTCAFRLPYCVRSDRKFCSSRCRVWAFRHPGQKRADAPCLARPLQADRSLPQTQSDAVAELVSAREYIAQLETAMQAQQDELLKQTAALAATKQRARQPSRFPESPGRREQLSLFSHEPAVGPHAAAAEQALAQKDRELSELRTRLSRCERAHEEVAGVAAELQRSLKTEKDRRLGLEQQLARFLNPATQGGSMSRPATWDAESAWRAQQRADQLVLELEQLRLHRDQVLTERERLSARILRLMMPGQYLSHAAGAGYDPTTDPLIHQMRTELPVLDRYAGWQSVYMKRVTARTLDAEKTLDEQCIEAALAARWRLTNRPLKRLRGKPSWRIIGMLSDEKSERLLLTLSAERVAEMQRRMA